MAQGLQTLQTRRILAPALPPGEALGLLVRETKILAE
jgi:hypothetical protein